MYAYAADRGAGQMFGGLHRPCTACLAADNSLYWTTWHCFLYSIISSHPKLYHVRPIEASPNMGMDCIQLPDNSSVGQVYHSETGSSHDKFQKGVAGRGPQCQDCTLPIACSLRSGHGVCNGQNHQGQGQRCCGIVPRGISDLERRGSCSHGLATNHVG